MLLHGALVAQLDRASGYEPEGREFESLRAHHTIPSDESALLSLICLHATGLTGTVTAATADGASVSTVVKINVTN